MHIIHVIIDKQSKIFEAVLKVRQFSPREMPRSGCMFNPEQEALDTVVYRLFFVEFPQFSEMKVSFTSIYYEAKGIEVKFTVYLENKLC